LDRSRGRHGRPHSHSRTPSRSPSFERRKDDLREPIKVDKPRHSPVSPRA